MLAAEAELVPVIDGETRSVDMQLGPALAAQEMDLNPQGDAETLPPVANPEPATILPPPSPEPAFARVLDAFQIAETASSSIGDVLDRQLGIARRSFGTGNARPIVRGFDGDRVLLLEDGVSVGSLASQSGDPVEAINATGLNRIEFLKGPSTLLYGINPMGLAINAVSTDLDTIKVSPLGLRGRVSSSVGTGDGYAGSSVNLEVVQRDWRFWLSGGGQRAGDYNTPIGPVDNSRNRSANGTTGFSWFGGNAFLGAEYRAADGRYGIPFADPFPPPDGPAAAKLEAVNIDVQRQNVRFFGGARDLGSAIEGFEFTVNYSNWDHDEVETRLDAGRVAVASFEDWQLNYRAVFEQLQRDRLDGRFGVSVSGRSYRPMGDAVLLPPVRRGTFSLFAVEELDFDKFRLEFGGRFDRVSDQPRGVPSRRLYQGPDPGIGGAVGGVDQAFRPSQIFFGGSASIGAQSDLWEGGTFRVDLTRSFRAPALEELYSLGAYSSRLTFPIEDSSLRRELSNGIDVSLRHNQANFRSAVGVFYYDIDNFVYFSLPGRFRSRLLEPDYLQSDAWFRGVELDFDFKLRDSIWLDLGMDMVQAKLKAIGTPPPQFPPLRATIGLNYRLNRLTIRPQFVVADSRNDVFLGETLTPGYGLFNLTSTYTIPRERSSHQLTLDLFNAGNRLYRNHANVLKTLVPEMGWGVRFSYAVEFMGSPRTSVPLSDAGPGEVGERAPSVPER